MRIFHLLVCLLGILAIGFCPPAGAKTMTGLAADELFSGLTTSNGVFPVVVTISNGGPPADGNIVVESAGYSEGGHRYLYPISLPTGSTKQVVAYPQATEGSGQLRVSFEGSHSSSFSPVLIPLPYADSNTRSLGLVGDKIGGMAALRLINVDATYSSQVGRFNDSYAQPELAPDRASGYGALSAVVISDGAERMQPAQWEAIHQYVIGGGSVIVLGGAQASYLKLPAAQPIVPLENIHATVFAQYTVPTGDGGIQAVSSVAAQTGDLKPGASAITLSGGNVAIATERIGAGVVIYCAVNPLDNPLHSSAAISGAWKQLADLSVPRRAVAVMREMAEGNGNYVDEYGGSSYASSSYSYPYDPDRGNPFRIKLPATSTITWMLLAYFVVVVPGTFFALRKAKRLEWAWVTSPLVSLAFAFGFYLFTADLYKASMSRRTGGVITAEAGNPSARFSGKTDIFFPHGGSYQIAIDSAESLEASNGEGRPVGGMLESVDNGAVQIPSLSATNLAYRTIEHEQGVNWGGGVTAELEYKAGGELSGKITNATGKPLSQAMLYLPTASEVDTIGDIPAGQSVSVSATDLSSNGRAASSMAYGSVSRLPQWAQEYFKQTTAQRTDSDHVAILVASTDGDRFGPQIGHYAGTPNSVQVMVSIPLRGSTK